MVVHHNVTGFDECVKLLNSLEQKAKVVLYFSGTVNEKGENWCPDCQVAQPIVDDVLKENEKKDFIFIHVAVGTRDEWKNPACKFRTDQRFKLTSVPTMMIYKSVERLNDVECQDRENVKMLIEGL
ncbi:hypothetical protein RUM43_005501 [Polyplax serrata]|uniref:Thioredoxin domain-containing protein 17 n=1 Tax=Polyplax serrata TaxID=468196 RepID=A0AAN8S2X4_POLSC